MKAFILAAGLGTRLKPLTDTLPKALVQVGGKPIVAGLIQRLKLYGYDEFVVNIHHFADKIVDYILSEDDFGVKIDFSDERDSLLETGGALLRACDFLQDCRNFLVHNVDIISNLDFTLFRNHAENQRDTLATLVVSDRQTSRYLLFDKSMRLVGWENRLTGEIRSPYLPDGTALNGSSYVENCAQLKDAVPLAFSGIYYAADRILPLLEEYSKSGIHTGGHPIQKFSIIDFYLSVCAAHRIYGYIPAGFNMVDAGKIDSLGAAEAFIQDFLPESRQVQNPRN